MPISMNPLPYVIAFLLVTNIVSALGWKAASSEANEQKQKVVACQATHKAFVDQTRAQGEQAAKQAKAVETNNRRIFDETAHGWASALDVVRNDAARRVRQSAAASSGSRALPEAGQAAGQTSRSSEDALPPTERIVADCAETTLTLVWLQHWITETQEAANE